MPPGEPRAPVAAQPESTVQGERVGTFLLDGGITVGEYYDDNIFATHTDHKHDFITDIAPYVTLRSAWARHALNFDASANLGRYGDFHAENYNDYHVGVDGRFDLTAGSNLFGGASFDHLHESRESPDAVSGSTPTTYSDTQSFLGTLQQFDAWKVRLGGTFQRLDFNDVSATGGTINNDDRDRNIYELGSRVSRSIAPGYEAFAQGAWNWRRYNAAVDDLGFRRDSHGTTIDGGLRYQPSNQLDAEVFAGYLWQSYSDAAFNDVGAFDYGARLNWRASPSTRVTGSLDRTLEETTLSGSPGYLDSVARLGIDHDLRRDLTLSTDVSYGIADYQDSDRNDRMLGFGTGLKYYLTPNVFIGPEYRFFRRDSSEGDANYDENQIWLRLGARLSNAYDASAEEPQPSGDSGFYFGTQIEHEQLHTKLNGPRGSGGSISGAFGNTGFGGGLFGGYGANIDNWYLGAELTGDDSEASWGHARVPGGRVFSVARGPSYGLGARFGYWLPQGALTYMRLGVARTEFDTDYRTSSGRAFDQTNDRYGPRVGVGLEAPLTNRWFLRLDYTYTDYGDYDVTVPSSTDTFSNSENLFGVGVGYRFQDDPRAKDVPVKPSDFAGFYAGPIIGYSAIGTENSGPRDSGSTLTADRAGGGPNGGVLGGFGTLFGRWYVGGEVSADVSDANWKQTREETGRVYSVNKSWDVGAALRVGYVLPHATLVYARVGPALTRFKNDYQNESNQSFKTDDTLTAVRYGAGVEVPAGDQWFVRADYTYAKYSDYTVDYGTGVDSFTGTTDSTFELGLMYRF